MTFLQKTIKDNTLCGHNLSPHLARITQASDHTY